MGKQSNGKVTSQGPKRFNLEVMGYRWCISSSRLCRSPENMLVSNAEYWILIDEVYESLLQAFSIFLSIFLWVCFGVVCKLNILYTWLESIFRRGFLVNTDRPYIHESCISVLTTVELGCPYSVAGQWTLCYSSFLAVSCWWIVYWATSCLFSSFSRDGDFKVKSGFTQHHHGYIFHRQLSLEELCFHHM